MISRFIFPVFSGLFFSSFILLIQSCGGGGGGGASSGCILGAASNVTVSGVVTFDRVPHDASGLDYSNISQDPARGVVVEAVCGGVISNTVTDASGNYSLSIPGNTSNLFIRVKAQMLQTSTSSWNFQVVDNTSSGALYTMDGATFDSDTANSTRNLHADSGWTGSSYGNTRVAAPFAILDSVYSIVEKILLIDPATTFPPLKLNWSVNNTTIQGNPAAGQIGTSAYDGTQIYILGDEDSDTDEYDQHVIVHEWGHYFEDKFSRSDSIGGYHGLGDYLDMRVAFGEGFGNAFAAMILDDEVYKDAHGASQSLLFDFNIESDNCSPRGWYSECSVQEILYDIYDSVNDFGDSLSLGLAPIYNVLINEQRITPALTSVFPFITALKTYYTDPELTYINNLVASHDIVVNDVYGTGQGNTTSAPTVDVLPIYTTINPGSTTSTPLCTTNYFQQSYFPGEYDNFNKLTSTRFLKLTVSSPGTHTITATRTSGANSPGLGLYYGADGSGWIDENYAYNSNTVSITRSLGVGTYIIESYDMQVSDTVNPASSACYNISVIKVP